MDFDPDKDYYHSLQVEPSATAEDVKKAFFGLAKRYHPDTQKDKEDQVATELRTEKLREVNEAYHVLSDVSARAAYDRARVSRERGHAEPQEPGVQPDAPASGDGMAVPPTETPPVIQSDRGEIFVRKAGRPLFIGQDGRAYVVTPEGRIRLADPAGVLGRFFDRSVIVGSASEVLVWSMLRAFARFLFLFTSVVWHVLYSYPLGLSMLLIETNSLKRIAQERVYLGRLRYFMLWLPNVVILAFHVVLAQISPAIAGVSLAFHLLAAAYLFRTFRLPYLSLLARYGMRKSPRRGAMERWMTYVPGIAYALHVFLITWLLARCPEFSCSLP